MRLAAAPIGRQRAGGPALGQHGAVAEAAVVTAPPLDVDAATADAFDRALRSARDRGGPVGRDLPAPVHVFLRWLAEERGMLLHGSNDVGIGVFEPRNQTDAEQRATRAVFAAADGLWPMFFAVVDRGRRHLLRNGFWRDDEGRRHYRFAVDAATLAGRHFVAGAVYVLPRDGFTPCLDADGQPTEEWLCPTEVVPVTRVPVEPADFPFLGDVAGFDATDVFAAADALHAIERAATGIREDAQGVTFTGSTGMVRHVAALLATLPALELADVAAAPVHDTRGDLAGLRLSGSPGLLATLRRWASLPA